MPKVRPALFFSIACTMLMASTAHAQYKWIEANGRIGYGDRLPSHNVKILKSPPTIARTVAGNEAAADTTGDMPYELRAAVRSAPVTLYTTPNCGPCDMARDHLIKRGIPFSEKVVSSSRDVKAFQDLGFPSQTGLPLITAGSTQEIGYHGLRWDDLLSRSGYPNKSVLPPDYRGPAAESLAASVPTGQRTEPVRGSVLAQQRNSPYGKPVEQNSVRF